MCSGDAYGRLLWAVWSKRLEDFWSRVGGTAEGKVVCTIIKASLGPVALRRLMTGRGCGMSLVVFWRRR